MIVFCEVLAIVAILASLYLVIESFIRDRFRSKRVLFICIFFFFLALSFPAKVHYIAFEGLYLHIKDIAIFTSSILLLLIANQFLKVELLYQKLNSHWIPSIKKYSWILKPFIWIRNITLRILVSRGFLKSNTVESEAVTIDQPKLQSAALNTQYNSLGIIVGIVIVAIAIGGIPTVYSIYPNLRNSVIVSTYPFETKRIEEFPNMDISSASFHSIDRALTMMLSEGNSQKVANSIDTHRSVDEQGSIIITPYTGRTTISTFLTSPGFIKVRDYETNKKNPNTISAPIEIYREGKWMRGLDYQYYKLSLFKPYFGLNGIWSKHGDTKPVVFEIGGVEKAEQYGEIISYGPFLHVPKIGYYVDIDGPYTKYISPKRAQKTPKLIGKPIFPKAIEQEIVLAQVADRGFFSIYFNGLREDVPSVPEVNLTNSQKFYIKNRVTTKGKNPTSEAYLQAYDLYEANAQNTNSVIYFYTFDSTTGKGARYSLIYKNNDDSNEKITLKSLASTRNNLKVNQLVSPWPTNSDTYLIENFQTLKLNGKLYSFAGIYRREESSEVDYSKIANFSKPVSEVGIVGIQRDNLDSSTFAFQNIHQFHDWLVSGTQPKIKTMNTDDKAIQLIKEGLDIYMQNHSSQ